jgi:hypothetical protein
MSGSAASASRWRSPLRDAPDAGVEKSKALRVVVADRIAGQRQETRRQHQRRIGSRRRVSEQSAFAGNAPGDRSGRRVRGDEASGRDAKAVEIVRRLQLDGERVVHQNSDNCSAFALVFRSARSSSRTGR